VGGALAVQTAEIETALIYVDTYTAICLYAGNIGALPPNAKKAIDGDEDLRISPMVVLELEYLRDRKRVLRDAWRDVVSALEIEWGVRICDYPFPVIAATAADKVPWTGDPFDRIIVAHAMANGSSPLVTPDRAIRRHYPPAIWLQ
jgi:PIN domain nuclease of toxin-antitoxin system